MPSAANSILTAVQAAAFVTLLCTSFTTNHAIASPFAMPLMAPDYSRSFNQTAPRDTTTRKSLRNKHAIQHNQTEHTLPAVHENPAPATPSPAEPAVPASSSPSLLIPALGARTLFLERKRKLSDKESTDRFERMKKSYDGASENSEELKRLAHRSSSVKDNDKEFQQQSALALTGFQGNVLDFQSVLKELGKEKGLAYYDRENDLETLLKETVDLHKDTLEYVTILCYNDPILGSALGPIVYEIKCLLDDILNACENLTDAILNAIKPLLGPLIGKWTETSCGFGFNLGGLCL